MEYSVKVTQDTPLCAKWKPFAESLLTATPDTGKACNASRDCPAAKRCFVASRRETAASNYYDVLQLDEEDHEEQEYFAFGIHPAPALTHQTGCDLLLPQTLSLKGQAAFRQAETELEGTMRWVYHAL